MLECPALHHIDAYSEIKTIPANYNLKESHTSEGLSVAREQANIVFVPAKIGATRATMPARHNKSQPHTPFITMPSLTPGGSDFDFNSDSESSDGSDVMEKSNRQAMAAANSSWKALRAESSDKEDQFGLARSTSSKKPKLGKEGKAWRQRWMETTLLAGRIVLKTVQLQGIQQITT